MPSFFEYLGLSGGPSAGDENRAVRALPASWFTSKEMYELERRAIFSRKWMLITHQIRLKKPGDFLRFDIAGFQFVLAVDRDGNVNGFHNVCRHRAFPVVREEKGHANIFSCLYHGWSYGLNGKLAKAPGYQDLPTFDKSKNGLFPIHIHIDLNGFIWVNLDGKPTPEISWEDQFGAVDKLPRYNNFNPDNFEYDHSWSMDGNYNWKILADNYNECYHCTTTHPDLPALSDLSAYSVETVTGSIRHFPATTKEKAAAGLDVAPTYFFPNASMTVAPSFMYIQRFVPSGPTTCSMLYEVYRNKNSPHEEFETINQIYKRVMSEDKVLCDLTQKNLDSGVFVNGEMHPKLEKGPLYFQQTVRQLVQDHHKREQVAKQEIWPARQQLPPTAMISGKDIEFCSSLACASNQERLAW